MRLTSSEFTDQGTIPKIHTCDGDDVSPPLAFNTVPAETQTLVLIIDDPDAPDPKAPKMTWVHWVLYNLPADTKGLPQDIQPKDLPPGTFEGINDWKETGYRGPCPPVGRHRYFHKLYALDKVLPNLNKPTKAQLEKAMAGRVLAEAVLVGTYAR